MKNAHLHRFGDLIALSLPGKGETLYFTRKEARAIAKALNAGARDVCACKFTDSTFGSPEIELSNAGKR